MVYRASVQTILFSKWSRVSPLGQAPISISLKTVCRPPPLIDAASMRGKVASQSVQKRILEKEHKGNNYKEVFFYFLYSSQGMVYYRARNFYPQKKEAIRPLNPRNVRLCFSVLLHNRVITNPMLLSMYQYGQRQRWPSNNSIGDPLRPPASVMPGNGEAICCIMTFFSQLIDARTWKPSLTWPLTRVQPAKHHLSPALASQSQPDRGDGTGGRGELKSRSDDNETVLGRGILVRINSLIHLIRLFWSMTHPLEWIQVIKLELLPWTGNPPLGTKGTH